jgi:hypothetical protein
VKQTIYIGLFALTLTSCGRKYEMTNMLPETIDVTNYIEDGQFRPDTCEGRLDRLIRLKPMVLDSNFESRLQDKLIKWETEYNNWLLKQNLDTINFTVDKLADKTKYQYSYFQTDEPIDVYRTDLGIEINGIQNFKLFLGLDKNGELYSDYKEDGWIINSCDTANSIIQDIYEQKK